MSKHANVCIDSRDIVCNFEHDQNVRNKNHKDSIT